DLGEEAVPADVEAPALALDGAADPAHHGVGLDDGGRDAGGHELGGGGEPRRPGADDDHLEVGPGFGRCRHPDQTARTTAGSSSVARNQSMVRRRPSARSTFGSQPSTARARLMSGLRTVGSSSGRGTYSSGLSEPTRSRTSSASSVIDTSHGLPMFTGPASRECSSRTHPSTRSSTYWMDLV